MKALLVKYLGATNTRGIDIPVQEMDVKQDKNGNVTFSNKGHGVN